MGKLSSYFIHHPRFAAVIALLILLAGGISTLRLPIAQFPEIAPPQVTVSAVYPGANAEVIETTIAAPLEQELNGVDGMISMSSNSDDHGAYSLNITFDMGVDPEIAAINVQNRVQLVLPRLPQDVQTQGVRVRKQSSSFLMVVSMSGDNKDLLSLSNYTSHSVLEAIKRVPGVGDARIFGAHDYSMRIWLNPDRMSHFGLSADDIRSAIRAENIQASVGSIGAAPMPEGQQMYYTIKARGHLQDPREFEDIILKSSPEGGRVYLRDVAKVEIGAKSYASFAKRNGHPSIQFAVYQKPGTNALDVVSGVKETLNTVSQSFPKGVGYDVIYDTSVFIKATFKEVFFTLAFTFIIVISVTYLFLGSWRATLIPSIVIPVSLIGTFCVLYFLGLSANTVTLFALILSVGLVVDDAIIVVENTQRIMDDEGMSPKAAAIQAMRQVSSPIIATTLVLLSVFIPISFLPGITGQLYKQFSISLSVAVSISSILALTLSPAMCAVFLRQSTRLSIFQKCITWMGGGYERILTSLSPRLWLTGLIITGLSLFVLWAYPNLPKGFLPEEDQGVIFINVQLPYGASLQRTEKVVDQVGKILQKHTDIKNYIGVNGFSILSGSRAPNNGMLVVMMKDWKNRSSSPFFTFLNHLRQELNQIPSAKISAFIPPSIRGLGRSNGFDFRLQDTEGRSPQDLFQAMTTIVKHANQSPKLKSVFSTFTTDAPQLFITINPQKARSFGVTRDRIYQTLHSFMGTRYINDFTYKGRIFQVIMQAEDTFRNTIEGLNKLYVKNDSDQMVPLSNLIDVKPTTAPQQLSRYNLFRSVRINGEAAPSSSSQEAMSEMEAIANKVLPKNFTYSWSSLSYQERKVGNEYIWVCGLAFLFAYLFLVANYESWTLPLPIIISVVFAFAGTLMGLYFAGIPTNVYVQIGVVMLIGLASKNAILIVEFCKNLRDKGMDVKTAAICGAKQRFRALLMTAFSFIFGLLPLIFAAGAGAVSRKSMGITVFSGMLAASCIGILFIPNLYVIFSRKRR